MENRLDPELRNIFSSMPEVSLLDHLDTVRKSIMDMNPAENRTIHDAVSISNRMIPGPQGAPDIRIRLYEPKIKTASLPGLLWIHGGGMVFGTPEQEDEICERFVSEAHCLAVSVDYRLAPEHPYPAGLEDCYTALKWFADHAEALGADASRLAIGGASAGGGLAAAVALLARDRQGPSLVFQMPLYPMIDNRNRTPSSHEITDRRVWNRETNIRAWQMYLGANRSDEVKPYATPARAKDLSGLPPAYTFIGELDVFRDETIDYVARLLQAGVHAEFHLYPGCIHAFEFLAPQAEVSKRSRAATVSALKRALHRFDGKDGSIVILE